MTKKHFIALAKRIAEIVDDKARFAATIAVADVAEKFNPEFDRAKFVAACNIFRTY